MRKAIDNGYKARPAVASLAALQETEQVRGDKPW